MALLLLIVASLSICVNGCPFLLQPISLNTSEGTTVNFTAIVCGGSVYWAVNNVPHIPSYHSVEISVYQTTLRNDSIRSDLVITSSPKYNNAEITATVYIPQLTTSNKVFLKIQGLLTAVGKLYFNISTKWLSWLPPPTLDGVDILHYIVSVIDTKLNVVNYTTNSTSTNISLSHLNFISCQRYELIVVPVNIIGEGEGTSQQYYHIGVPGVKEEDILVMSEKDISINIRYKVTYDCQDQKPVNISTRIKDLTHNNNYKYYGHDKFNNTVLVDNDTIIGIYLVNNLPNNSHLMGQLIVNTLTDKASSQEFEFWTFDIKDVIIYTVAGSVCVNVTYVTVTDAKGFNIKAMSYKTLSIYEVNVPYDHDNTTYCLSLPVDEYNITIHDWERDYTISTKFRKMASITVINGVILPTNVDIISTPVDTRIPTSVVMARFSPSPTTHYPSPTDISTDINSKSSDNKLVIGIVIGILGIVVFVSLIAGFCIALYKVHIRKKADNNSLDFIHSQHQLSQDSYNEDHLQELEPRYATTVKSESPLYHLDEDDHVYPDDWLLSTPVSADPCHYHGNNRPLFQTRSSQLTSYQQNEEMNNHSNNIVSETVTPSTTYHVVAANNTEIVTYSDFVVMPLITPVLRETTSVESGGQLSEKITHLSSQIFAVSNPASSSYVPQTDEDDTLAIQYLSEPADISMSDVTGIKSSYVITSTTHPIQKKTTSAEGGNRPHSDTLPASNPRYAELQFLKNSGAKPVHTENIVYSEIVPSVPKKKISKAGAHENVVIRPRPIIPSSRLHHISSSQPDNDKGYSSTFGRNTFSSENTDTELPTDYLTHSHQAENTSSTTSVVVPANIHPLVLPPHPSSTELLQQEELVHKTVESSSNHSSAEDNSEENDGSYMSNKSSFVV